jgi:hypothetical protein
MLPYGNSRLICSRTASSLAALGRIVQIIEQAITVLLLYHERGFARALAINELCSAEISSSRQSVVA